MSGILILSKISLHFRRLIIRTSIFILIILDLGISPLWIHPRILILDSILLVSLELVLGLLIIHFINYPEDYLGLFDFKLPSIFLLLLRLALARCLVTLLVALTVLFRSLV